MKYVDNICACGLKDKIMGRNIPGQATNAKRW
jgi:hypothetical protein